MKNKNIWSLILSAAARSVEYKSIFYNLDGIQLHRILRNHIIFCQNIKKKGIFYNGKIN